MKPYKQPYTSQHKYAYYFLLLFLCSFLGTTIPMYSQTDTLPNRPSYAATKTLFKHLQGYKKLLIKTNLDSLMLNKKEGKKQLALISMSNKDTTLLKLPIKIAARGVFRRRTCELPPIWIDFHKDTLSKLGLYPAYDKLKLVTICLLETDNRAALLKEYWLYKMHNQLTDNSFQVHLLETIFVHSEDPKRKIRNLSFIIENTHEMAHRLDGVIVEGMGKLPTELTTSSYHQTILFNYMIGNTDWHVKLQKNVKFVQKAGEEKLTLIPYDFDFSTFVKPSYFKFYKVNGTKPNPENRVALGKFNNKAALYESMAVFRKERKTGLRCFKDCSLLTMNDKKELYSYLQPFFQQLKNDKWMESVFLEEKISEVASINDEKLKK